MSGGRTHERTVLLLARQELLLAVRSRWTHVFATTFALLALGVAASGYVLSGGSGFQDLARTSASLVQLVVLVVPLAALVMGVLAVAPEPGTAELLFSQPVSRRAILVGQLLGLFVAITAAEWVGFGAAGLIVFSQSGGEGVPAYLLLVLGAALLTAVYLSIAAVIAAGAAGAAGTAGTAGSAGRKRGRALAVALVVWFGSVILFDVAALGVASLLPSRAASRLLIVSVIANPAGAIRTGALLGIEGSAAFGSASLAFLRVTGGPLGAASILSLSIVLWILLPLVAAVRRLDRVDL